MTGSRSKAYGNSPRSLPTAAPDITQVESLTRRSRRAEDRGNEGTMRHLHNPDDSSPLPSSRPDGVGIKVGANSSFEAPAEILSSWLI